MAHIVIVTGGLTGLFRACLALMQQLQQAGHQITYAAPGNVPTELSTLNVPAVSLPAWKFPSEKTTLNHREKIRHLKDRQQQAVADLKMDVFAQQIQQLSPDLLLIDIELHPHIMTAVAAKYLVALLCPFISLWRHPHIPPIHTSTLPGEGWRGQPWGVLWSWLRYSWQKRKTYQRDRLQKAGCDYITILKKYAQQIHYPFQSQFGLNQWLVPYPHQNLPILCLHARELDFPHQPHPSMHYLGPMVHQPLENSLDANTHQKVRHFIKAKGHQPLIYCGLSSFTPARPQYLQHIVQTASNNPNWKFIIGLGKNSHTQPLNSLLNNLLILDWAPQIQLLKQADCAIINGGAHSITECIYFGLPMIVSPLSRDDQNGNAARVKYHGLGKIYHPTHSEPKQLQTVIQTVLKEQTYKAKVMSMRDQFHRYKNNSVAATTINQLLSTATTSPSARLQEVAP